MATNYQVFPAAGAPNPIVVNGRTYSYVSTPLLVPEADAFMMCANGWIKSGADGAGTTAQRPSAPRTGLTYYDTTVGASVIWTGAKWVHHGTAANA